MISAKASSTAGFIAVSLAAAMASAGAPARPLLKCRDTRQCRLAVNSASPREFLPVRLQERGRKPCRLVAVQDLSRFAQIGRPEHIGLGGARAVVRKHHAGELLEHSRVPELPGRHGRDPWRRLDAEILRRTGQPVEERAPDCLRLLLVQPLEHHGDRKDVARPEGDLLAPVRIEEALAVEADDPADQPAERGVRRRLDRQVTRRRRTPADHGSAA